MSNDGIAAVADAGCGAETAGLAAAVGRAAAPAPLPDVGPGDAAVGLPGAGVAGLPYVVPWLFVAGRAAPFGVAPGVTAVAAAEVAAAGVDDAGVLFAGACFAGLETVGLETDGPEAAGLAAFVGVAEAPVTGVAPPPGLPAACFVAADGASGLAGCFGVAGFVDGAVVLFRPASRDGVPEPPTVALPTVAFPTAAEARAGPPEF